MNRRRDKRRAVLLTTLLVVASATARAAAPTLADCDARVAANPRDPGAYYCYVIAAQASGRFDEAIRRLQALLAVDPSLHRAQLNIAILEHDLGRPAAVDSYLRAIDGLERDGDAWGLVYAHSGLGAYLDLHGRSEEAGPHFDRALERARASGEPLMLAHARVRAAIHADQHMDYGTALRLFREAETVVFPDGPTYLKSWILSGLGRVYWALGERRRALAVYERELDHLQATGNRYGEAATVYNIALVTRQLADEGQADPAAVRPLVERALRLAVESGNRGTEGTSHGLLSEMLQGPPAVEEARRALSALEESGTLEQVLRAKRGLALSIFLLGPEHHEEARSILEGAIDEARAAGDPFSEARGLVGRSTFRLLSGAPREETVAAFTEAIEAVERIRELQPEQAIRARSFGEWTFLYTRLAGYLLQGLPSSPRPEEDLELAFATLERRRARVLLDVLDSADVSAGSEADGRRQRPEVPPLRHVREQLDAHQALLAFHLVQDELENYQTDALRFGGSWVMCITRGAVRAFRVPDRLALQRRVAVYRGTFAARDGSDAVPSVRLYDDLLAEAMDSLAPEIDRLVIVPDGVLHELPFGTLRPGAGAPPLAERFSIAYAPSVTLWARSRERPRKPRPAPMVLALADPDLGTDVASPLRESDERAAESRATRLPHAEDEARVLLRGLGGTGRLLTGAKATEGALETTDLSKVDLLHFAAHAVVDRNRPERSAVLLAAGPGDEDGLLRMSEIADLRLDGQLVVLSACRSASGELIEGEGVVGLSRAFFRAGAGAVVGSLWPLRDEEAAGLVGDFADELGSGRSVADALARARRRRIEAGAPTEAWAGLVVLGDGDLVLTEPRRRRWPLLPASAVFLAVLLVWGLIRGKRLFP